MMNFKVAAVVGIVAAISNVEGLQMMNALRGPAGRSVVNTGARAAGRQFRPIITLADQPKPPRSNSANNAQKQSTLAMEGFKKKPTDTLTLTPDLKCNPGALPQEKLSGSLHSVYRRDSQKK